MRKIRETRYALAVVAIGAVFQFITTTYFVGSSWADEVVAQENSKQNMTMAAEKKEPCKDDPGAPCLSHDATSSDRTYDGIQCQQVTGAKACNTQGAPCGTGDAGKCRTLLNYQGICKCFCVYPGM